MLFDRLLQQKVGQLTGMRDEGLMNCIEQANHDDLWVHINYRAYVQS